MDGYTLMQCLVRMTPKGEEDLNQYPPYRYLMGRVFQVRAVPTYPFHRQEDEGGWEYIYTDEYRTLRFYAGEVEVLEEDIDADEPW